MASARRAASSSLAATRLRAAPTWPRSLASWSARAAAARAWSASSRSAAARSVSAAVRALGGLAKRGPGCLQRLAEDRLLLAQRGCLGVELVGIPAGPGRGLVSGQQGVTFAGEVGHPAQSFGQRGELEPGVERRLQPGRVELLVGVKRRLLPARLSQPVLQLGPAGQGGRLVRPRRVPAPRRRRRSRRPAAAAWRRAGRPGWSRPAGRSPPAVPSGPRRRRSSPVRSTSRVRLTCMASSLRRAFSLRRRCLSTPAASSISARRASGPACSTSSRLPWPTITCISRPRPESESSSVTSRSRHWLPLMAYSLWPDLKSRRLMVTSV